MARDPFRGWKLALWSYAATFFFVLYAPLVMIAVLSFNDSEITGFPITEFSLRWYRTVLGSSRLLEAFGHSVAVGIAAALIATALALGLSLAFRHDFRGKGALLNLVLVPMVIPGIIGGIVLLIFFGYAEVRSSLMSTVLVAHVNWVLPFAFLTLYPRVHRFDPTLEEAAMDLGAPVRVGFQRPHVREWSHLFANVRVPLCPTERHRVLGTGSLSKAAGRATAPVSVSPEVIRACVLAVSPSLDEPTSVSPPF